MANVMLGAGGGIYVGAGVTTLRDCTLVGNASRAVGGAVLGSEIEQPNSRHAERVRPRNVHKDNRF